MSFLETLKARLNAAFTPDLNFESKWVVNVSDTQVSCTRPNGQVESLNWDDLNIVVIETTNEGRMLPMYSGTWWGNKPAALFLLGPREKMISSNACKHYLASTMKRLARR